MPIEVRYGEDPGALATLAMLAGMQQQKVPQIPQMTVGRGGGGGGGGGRAPQRRTVARRPAARREPSFEKKLRLEAEYKIKEEYWGQQLEEERMQLENEMAAEGWELKYDAAARKTWQRGNDSLRKIDEGERNGTIAPNEAEAMRTQVKRNMFGVGKSLTPPDPNKIKFIEGQEPGVLWPGEGGSIMTTDPETGMPKLIQRWDQGPEATKLKYEAEERKASLDLQTKQAEAYRAAKFDLMKETAMVPVRGGEKGEEMEMPKYTSRGADAFLKRVGFVNPMEQMGAEAQEAIAPEQMEAQRGEEELYRAWIQEAPVTKEDEDMPEPAAKAQAYLRIMNRKIQRGVNIGPRARAAMQMAQETLEEHLENL